MATLHLRPVLAVLLFLLLSAPALAHTGTTTSPPTTGTAGTGTTGPVTYTTTSTGTPTTWPYGGYPEHAESSRVPAFTVASSTSSSPHPDQYVAEVSGDLLAASLVYEGVAETGLLLYLRGADGAWAQVDAERGADMPGGRPDWLPIDLHGTLLAAAFTDLEDQTGAADRVVLYDVSAGTLDVLAEMPLPEGSKLSLIGSGLALGDGWLAVMAMRPSGAPQVLVYTGAGDDWALAHTLEDPVEPGRNGSFGFALASTGPMMVATDREWGLVLFDPTTGAVLEEIATGFTGIQDLAGGDGRFAITGKRTADGQYLTLVYDEARTARHRGWEPWQAPGMDSLGPIALDGTVVGESTGRGVLLVDQATGAQESWRLPSLGGWPVAMHLSIDGTTVATTTLVSVEGGGGTAAYLHVWEDVHVTKDAPVPPTEACDHGSRDVSACPRLSCMAPPVPAAPEPEPEPAPGRTWHGTTTTSHPSSAGTTTTRTAHATMTAAMSVPLLCAVPACRPSPEPMAASPEGVGLHPCLPPHVPVSQPIEGRATRLLPLRVELPEDTLLRYHVESATQVVATATVALDPTGLPVEVPALPQAIRYLHVEPDAKPIPLEAVTIEMGLDGLPEELAATMGVHFWDGEKWVDLAADADGMVPATTPEGDLRVLEVGRDLQRGIAWAKVSHTSTYALAPSESAPGPLKLEHKPADTTYMWIVGGVAAVTLAAVLTAAVAAVRRRFP